MDTPQIIIIELGSQFTLQIQRVLREAGIRSLVLRPDKVDQNVLQSVKAIILSGGGASVYDKNAPQLPKDLISLLRNKNNQLPVLGICYGMQILALELGGEVCQGEREYGNTSLVLTLEGAENELFLGTHDQQQVWMNHGDSVSKLPVGFRNLGNTKNIAAMSNGIIYGLQFHPEATQTQFGKEIFINFINLVGCELDWEPKSVVKLIQENLKKELKGRKAIIGVSGGVDSTTLAAIAAPILGKQLTAITIDPGNLREGEIDEIRKNAKLAGIDLHVIDASTEFIDAISQTVDAEEKRAYFKEVYRNIFMKAAKKFGAEVIIQGTLAADKIESGMTGGAKIKSHHNVGLDMSSLEQMHPIDYLYKYEIRALGEQIGLPKEIFNRQPFPGPGLFVRIIGIPITMEKLATLRWADEQVRVILEKHNIYDKVSQLVVAYIGVNTVGQKGDTRVYGNTIVVRPVTTLDFMTTEAYFLDSNIMKEICSTITKHDGIVRVWFDYTEKPPATTEME